MRTLLIMGAIVTVGVCYGQSAIEKCQQTFTQGLDSISDNELLIRLSNLRHCLIGEKFPEFKAQTIEGKQIRNSDLMGKVVLVNLWFIGCPPCIREIPILIELTSKYKGTDFVLLSFATDDKASLESFIEKKKINYLVVGNAKDLIENSLKLYFGYPTNIFLDRNGNIIDFKLGADQDEEGIAKTKQEFIRIIERALVK